MDTRPGSTVDEKQIVSAFEQSDDWWERILLLRSLGDVHHGRTGRALLVAQSLTPGPGRQDYRTVSLWTLAKYDLDEDESAELATLLRDRSGTIQECTARTLAERGTKNASPAVLAWLRTRLGKNGRAVVDGGWPNPADIGAPLLFAHRHGLGLTVQTEIVRHPGRIHPREVEWLTELGITIDETEWPRHVTDDVDSLRRWLYEGTHEVPVDLEAVNNLVIRLNS